MRNVINIKSIGVDRVGDSLCMFGEVEYECGESSMRVVFEGLPCCDMANVLNMVADTEEGKLVIPGLKIYSIKMNIDCFVKTVRKLFGLAIGSIPSEFVDITLKFKEEWE